MADAPNLTHSTEGEEVASATQPAKESADEGNLESKGVLLDVEELVELDGWEYFLNEADLSSSTMRCSANARFKLVDSSSAATKVAILEVPSNEMMFWDSRQVEELVEAIKHLTGAYCEISIIEVKGGGDTVLQRQNIAHKQWENDSIAAFRDNEVVKKLMEANGSQFDPNLIRFHEPD